LLPVLFIFAEKTLLSVCVIAGGIIWYNLV